MDCIFDDGGRERAGFKGVTGDCVARSIAIATGMNYRDVYESLNAAAHGERRGKRKRGVSSARTGVYAATLRRYMTSLGWRWVPTMAIGSGCTVHLRTDELPGGRLVVCVSRHVLAVIDGIIHDNHNPSHEAHCTEPYREPMPKGYWTHDNVSMHHIAGRCVYGYFEKG